METLRVWRERKKEERREWGPAYVDPRDAAGQPYHLVFTREDGSPLNPARVTQEFVRMVRESGLSHLKLHGLRHLNISLQLDAGVSETIIAMRVGHTSPALIRATYGHLVGTVGRRAAEATAALVPRKPKTGTKEHLTALKRDSAVDGGEGLPGRLDSAQVQSKIPN